MLWLQDGRLYILICHLISVSLESTVYMYHVHLNLCRETLTNLHIHHSFAIEIPSSLTTSQGPWNCQVSGGEQEVRQVWASLGTWDLNKIMASTSYLARKFAGSTYPATQFEASTTPTDRVATMDIKCWVVWKLLTLWGSSCVSWWQREPRKDSPNVLQREAFRKLHSFLFKSYLLLNKSYIVK